MKRLLFVIIGAVFLLVPGYVRAATSYDTYIWQKQVTTGLNSSAANAQMQELSREVAAIVSKGALAPLVIHYSDQPEEGYLMYQDRGRIIQTLAMAYPYVNSTQQSQITTYVKNMLSSGDENFMSNKLKTPGQGVQRRLHGSMGADKVPRDVFNNIPTLHLIYGMWLYGDKTGDWTTVQSYWPAIKTFYANNKNTNILYGSLNGYVAMARLSKQFNDSATLTTVESDISNQFGQALTLSTMETRTKSTLYAYFYDSRKVEFFTGQPWMFLNASPEILRFISDNSALKSAYLSRLSSFESLYSPWWLYQVPTFTRWSGDEGIGGTPELMNLFMNRERYVSKKPAATLATYMKSIPVGIGDIFWIEALISSVESNGSDCWENLTTTATECIPSATAVPTSIPTSTPTVDTCPTDINKDKLTDLSDYSILVANFLKSPLTNVRADINKDGFVDLSDYSLLVKKFLQPCP